MPEGLNCECVSVKGRGHCYHTSNCVGDSEMFTMEVTGQPDCCSNGSMAYTLTGEESCYVCKIVTTTAGKFDNRHRNTLQGFPKEMFASFEIVPRKKERFITKHAKVLAISSKFQQKLMIKLYSLHIVFKTLAGKG